MIVPDENRDILIGVSRTSTRKVDTSKVANGSGNIRVFFESRSSCALQIRTSGPINENGNGVSFQCYSHASLGIDAAIQLRDWLNNWLLEKTGS